MSKEELGNSAGVTLSYPMEGHDVDVSDPKIVQDMYTTHNKYFDKASFIQVVFSRLLGRSILTADTSPDWRKRRAAISPAFYKGKLVLMCNIAKDAMQTTISQWRKTINDQPRTIFNFIEEMQNSSARVLLSCALGEDLSETNVDYHCNGKVEKRHISFVLRQTFHDSVMRALHPKLIFFPFLLDMYITRHEREILTNCKTVRTLIQGIITRRREAIEKDPSLKDRGDFLTILLMGDTTKDDEELILDECLTFFFAGTQTTAIANSNLIFMLVKHPEVGQKILDEV
jgi:cytochrome P450